MAHVRYSAARCADTRAVLTTSSTPSILRCLGALWRRRHRRAVPSSLARPVTGRHFPPRGGCLGLDADRPTQMLRPTSLHPQPVAGQWHVIDTVSAINCVVSPCGHVQDIPVELQEDWARARVQVFDQITAARAAGDTTALERALKWHLVLHDMLLRGRFLEFRIVSQEG